MFCYNNLSTFRDTFHANNRHAYPMGKDYDRIAAICLDRLGTKQLTILL